MPTGRRGNEYAPVSVVVATSGLNQRRPFDGDGHAGQHGTRGVA